MNIFDFLTAVLCFSLTSSFVCLCSHSAFSHSSTLLPHSPLWVAWRGPAVFASVVYIWFYHLRRRSSLSSLLLLPAYAPCALALFTPPPLFHQLLLLLFCRAAAGASSPAFNLTIFIMITTENDYFEASICQWLIKRGYAVIFLILAQFIWVLSSCCGCVRQVLCRAASREFNMQIMCTCVYVCVYLNESTYLFTLFSYMSLYLDLVLCGCNRVRPNTSPTEAACGRLLANYERLYFSGLLFTALFACYCCYCCCIPVLYSLLILLLDVVEWPQSK